MNEIEKSFEEGFQYFCDNLGAAYAVGVAADKLGDQFEYIYLQQDQIGAIIEQIDQVINTYRNNTPGSRQGFLFEVFHRTTYDYNRIANHQGNLPEATQPPMKEYASPDVVVDGTKYNAKVYADSGETFRAIATAHRDDSSRLKYEGQRHLVVSDQKKDIITNARSGKHASAHRGTIKEEYYRELARNTVDHIEDSYGNESIPITKAELEGLDKQAINEQVNAETLKVFGIDPDSTISWDQLKAQLIEGCLKTGVTAAVIAAVFNIVPLIINAVSMLNEKGEFDKGAFCKLGYQALSVPAKGFLIGCSTSAIINALNYHGLKEAAKGASNATPLSAVQCSLIAIGVSILIGTVEIAIQRAIGKINRAEMADKIFECCLTSTLCIAGGMLSQHVLASLVSSSVQQAVNTAFAPILTPIISKLFGAAAAAAFPMFNVLSYLVGSLIGFAIAELIHIGTKKLFFSFCVESGCTFFGLVEQNYELPQEIIDAIGVEVFEYEKFEYDTFQVDTFQFDPFKPDSFEYDKFGIKILRRGVIELGKVSYIT